MLFSANQHGKPVAGNTLSLVRFLTTIMQQTKINLFLVIGLELVMKIDLFITSMPHLLENQSGRCYLLPLNSCLVLNPRPVL